MAPCIIRLHAICGRGSDTYLLDLLTKRLQNVNSANAGSLILKILECFKYLARLYLWGLKKWNAGRIT